MTLEQFKKNQSKQILCKNPSKQKKKNKNNELLLGSKKKAKNEF